MIIAMKTKAIGSFFVLFAIISTIAATAPSAFAVEVSAPVGSGVPGCEETNECYIPADITIAVGETVTWSNDDTAAHTVTSGSATDGPDGNFDSSLFLAGATFDHTFDTAGEFPYFCMVHPWMVGSVMVGEAMAEEEVMMEEETMMEEEAMAEGVMITIETGDGNAGETVSIDVKFMSMDGSDVEHVNYDISATHNAKRILDEVAVHDHDGMMSHTTMALESAASDANPVDVKVTFKGFGIDQPFTGPIGQVEEAQVVPEFGTIAMMILGVAIVSIVAVTAKSKVIPRL